MSTQGLRRSLAAIEASVPNREAYSSLVSWGAVIGGAFVTAALYLILLALGAGFGLSAVSLRSNVGPSFLTVAAKVLRPQMAA